MTNVFNPDKNRHFNVEMNAHLRLILRDRYIHTPQSADYWELLEDLMLQVDHNSPKPKVMGCLCTGASSSGKTTSNRQFKKTYLENVEGAKPTDIVYFQIPSRARLKGVIAKLCRQLRIPDAPKNIRNYPTPLLVEKAAHKLKADESKLVIIDEFQKLFELNGESRIEILSGFNDLLNESNVPISLTGVDGVDELLALDEHDDPSKLKDTFCTRFTEFTFNPWNDPHTNEYAGFLKTIYDDCHLQIPNNREPFYKNSYLRELVIDLTGGLTGKIIKLIKWTARNIVRRHLPGIITADLIEDTVQQLQKNGW